jgi:hypothetical protein
MQMLPPSRPMACVLSIPTKQCLCPFNDPKAERERDLGILSTCISRFFPRLCISTYLRPCCTKRGPVIGLLGLYPKTENSSPRPNSLCNASALFGKTNNQVQTTHTNSHLRNTHMNYYCVYQRLEHKDTNTAL